MAIGERWEGHPPLPPDLEERLPRVVDRLRRGGARLVYVFGSAAGSSAEGSSAVGISADDGPEPGDLDLATWGLEEDRWEVGADVAEILGTDRLDLVMLEKAGPELRYRIVADGRLLHSDDPALENRLELRILREYQDLAPFRRVQTRYLRARRADRGP